MINFQYARANDVADAVRQIAADPTAKFIAGGTNLIDLMKEDVERPARLIDISRLPLNKVEETADGGVRIGALVPNSDLAYHPLIEQRYPLLASAILAGASQQLRNMASTGGNLLQRTRCAYFYDTATPCNKREPGSGCSAINGLNRMHAILGTSEACIATHPSDMCVALAALDAKVHVPARLASARSRSRISIGSPATRRSATRISSPTRLITAVELPAQGFAANYTYLKIRDRLSYAFALVSVAAALELEGDTIEDARLALGGVAHKPWRDSAVEAALRGQTAEQRDFQREPPTCAARRQGLRAQRLQDRSGASGHRARADAGGARHAAVAVQQENPVSGAMQTYTRHTDLPHRRPRQGHGRSQVCGRVQRRPGLAYGSVVASTIAKGRIARIDASEALRVDGVIDVLRMRTGRRMADTDNAYKDDVAPDGSPFRPLYDDKIMFSGQPIALVLAEDAEIARFAASLVRVEYDEEPHVTDLYRPA